MNVGGSDVVVVDGDDKCFCCWLWKRGVRRGSCGEEEEGERKVLDGGGGKLEEVVMVDVGGCGWC